VIERIEREREVITDLGALVCPRERLCGRTERSREGMYVAPGTEMMMHRRPGSVWLIADVLGGQIDWLASGQTVA
jgi:hypothetical protein